MGSIVPICGGRSPSSLGVISIARGEGVTENTKISAKCECGQLSLKIETSPVAQLVCHCSDCRSVTGLPYIEIAFFAPSGCEARGQSHPTTMKGGSGNDKTYFSCRECGTALYATVGALDGAWAVIASRLSPFKKESQLHIWTSERASGVDIPPSATQAPKGPPESVRNILRSSFLGKR